MLRLLDSNTRKIANDWVKRQFNKDDATLTIAVEQLLDSVVVDAKAQRTVELRGMK